MISVIVDDREPDDLINKFHLQDNVALLRQRLNVGDYEIDGRLLIERKTLQDLVASIKDGRLFSQVCQLANSSLQTFILLEGSTKNLKSKMRREAIQGALLTISVYFGIPLLRSMDPQESVQIMLAAARQGRVIARGALPRKGKRPKGKRKRQLYVLQSLPNIGAERASALLAQFGSVEAVLSATSDQLQQVDGIGFGTAKKIRWIAQ